MLEEILLGILLLAVAVWCCCRRNAATKADAAPANAAPANAPANAQPDEEEWLLLNAPRVTQPGK